MPFTQPLDEKNYAFSSGSIRPRHGLALTTVLALGVCVLAVRFLAVGSGWYGPAIATLIFVAITAFAARGLRQSYPHAQLGLCNVITHVRAAFASFLSVWVFFPPATENEQWALVAIALLALSLDGVDGWAARRSGLASDFGARFDMEVDSFLAAVLALIVWRASLVGPLVLCLGFTRYAFLLAGLALPWLNAPLPPSLRRKVICVVQIASLILLLVPIVPPVAVMGIVVATSGALLASFAIDIIWLARNRKPL